MGCVNNYSHVRVVIEIPYNEREISFIRLNLPPFSSIQTSPSLHAKAMASHILSHCHTTLNHICNDIVHILRSFSMNLL